MLSYRLKRLTELMEKSNYVADIGTDHAYLPIFLVHNKLASNVFAIDINDEPLNIAKKNINLHNLQNQIKTIKSDGMNFFNLNSEIELDFTIISGLGSTTILKILNEWMNPQGKVIICSNTPLAIIRLWVKKHNYQIIYEELITDNNKYYWIIIIYFGLKQKLRKQEIEFGKSEFFKGNDLYKQYLSDEIAKFKKILLNLPSKNQRKVRYEIQNKIKRMEKFINEIA